MTKKVFPIGIAIWRALRNKRSSSQKEAPIAANVSAPPAPPNVEQEVESLSLNTLGDAPLDRLARRAGWEEREKDQPNYLNLSAPVPPGSDNPERPNEESVENLLENQSLESNRLDGWSVPEPRTLPIPTFAPAVMAFGIVVFALGLATVWYVCLVGSLVFAVAAWRWVGELQGSEE